MTKRWKSKTNSSNILLVLITLILIKSEWIKGEENNETQIYVGNDAIAEFFFRSSKNNDSIILEDLNKCLDNFQLITCIKMLLLSRINDAADLMERPNHVQKDVHLLNSILVLKYRNASLDVEDNMEDLSLDEEIVVKFRKIFQNRLLLLNLPRKIRIEIEPERSNNSTDICFQYHIKRDNEGRKRKGGMSMMMLVPPIIMLGLMPFTLASLKAMVMNAVMINMMALNGAIFMTIRNLVFGPRRGDNVKYVNYGYSKNRQTQSPKPVLIIHSPAAFVKQPPVHKKPHHVHHNDGGHYLDYSDAQYHHGTHFDGNEGHEYVVEQDLGHNNLRRKTVLRKHYNKY